MIQLAEHLEQDLLQPGVGQQPEVKPILLCSHGSLPEKSDGVQDHFLTFTTQC